MDRWMDGYEAWNHNGGESPGKKSINGIIWCDCWEEEEYVKTSCFIVKNYPDLLRERSNIQNKVQYALFLSI